MMAARKLNDTIAKTAVIGAVSSIGSSFPIEEVLTTGRAVGGLSVIANPCLLHRTKCGCVPIGATNAPAGDLVHGIEPSSSTAKRLQPLSAPLVNRRRGEPAVFRKPGNGEAAQILAATATQSGRPCGIIQRHGLREQASHCRQGPPPSKRDAR